MHVLSQYFLLTFLFSNYSIRIHSKMVIRLKISLDEEKITKLIKEVFEEEFKKQEVNITKIISSNFMLTM